MVNVGATSLSDLKGKNYVLKGKPENNYWVSIAAGILQDKTTKFGNDFFLIIHGATSIDRDYFVIPFEKVRHAFTDRNATRIGNSAKDSDSRPVRWTVNIKNNRLNVTNSGERIDVNEYYENSVLLERALRQSGGEAVESRQLDAESADTTTYDPETKSDARNRIERTITQRRGQRSFRDTLLDAYGRQCAISGCAIVDVLEAAHITPYLGPETNHVANGLLLRADLHTLLDCGLLAIDPATYRVMLALTVQNDPDYKALHRRRLRNPVRIDAAPSQKALEQAWRTWERPPEEH